MSYTEILKMDFLSVSLLLSLSTDGPSFGADLYVPILGPRSAVIQGYFSQPKQALF